MKTLYTTKKEEGAYEHSAGVYAKVVHTCQELKHLKAGWVTSPDKLDAKPESKVEAKVEPKVDWVALAEANGIPTEVEGKKVHHKTLKKQVEEALNASDKGTAS